jgi:HK97 family phage prohead protease
MKYLDHQLDIKSCEPDGTFWGYASVFNNLDHHLEIVSKGAFAKSLLQWRELGRYPKMLWQHDPRVPIGRWIDVKEDDHGLFVKGQILLDIRQGREAYALLKAGIVDGLSIGFHLVKAQRQDKARILQEIDLQEISLVTFAANAEAKVSSCKQWLMPYEAVNRLLARLNDLQGLLGLQAQMMG